MLLQYAVAMADRLLGMTGAVGPRMVQIDLLPHPDFGVKHLSSWFGDRVQASERRGTHIVLDPTMAERHFPRVARDHLLAGVFPQLILSAEKEVSGAG